MKREIKFRAWNEESELMITEPAYIQFSSDKDYQVFLEGDSEWVKDNCVLMQYTGLKDSKGKEIYEGDICKISDPYNENEKTFVVEYRNGGYVVEWDNMFCGGEADTTTIGWAMDSEFEINVIGNIYENPELKAKDD